MTLTSLQAVQGGGESLRPHPPQSPSRGENESPAYKCSFYWLFLVAGTSGKFRWWERKKKMKGGMGILHHSFPSEPGGGGMLTIGTGALAGQRARSAMAEACQGCHVLGTPGVGGHQEFTAVLKVIGATCGLTSLKGHLLLCVSPTQHKEGCWWD